MDSTRRIAWEIGLAFVLKLILLFALWALFFSPAHRPHVVPEAVGAQLLPLT